MGKTQSLNHCQTTICANTYLWFNKKKKKTLTNKNNFKYANT